MILLDTDVMIDILCEYPPAVTWIQSSSGDEKIALPGFVVMELFQGCRNKAEKKKIEREIKEFGIVWPSKDTCDKALSLFAEYHLSHGVGIIDVIIGQMAVDFNLPLYTFNQKHYSVIPNLNTIQPYQKGIA